MIDTAELRESVFKKENLTQKKGGFDPETRLRKKIKNNFDENWFAP